MTAPFQRHRRLRSHPALRELVRETRLCVENFIQPLFVVPGKGLKNPINSLPGQFQFSVDRIAEEAFQIAKLGIPGVLLFGVPHTKDEMGSAAWDDAGIVQEAIRAIKKDVPKLLTIADLCFCEYTSHGHCGVIVDGDVHNDLTLPELGKQAVSLAKAGADVVAPSGMMDGMVLAIREALDEADYLNTSIMSYAAKFASAYYGPFREAVDSTPAFGDRRTYQMDPANSREALREVEDDIQQGADILMVKPAMAYLDIIQRVKDTFDVPVAAYNVSGEYAMIKAAAERGMIDGEKVMLESLLAIKRAGTDIIISYFSKEVAPLIS